MQPVAAQANPDLFCIVKSLLTNERLGVIASPGLISGIIGSWTLEGAPVLMKDDETASFRSSLIDWLLTVHKFVKGKLEPFFAAVNIMDAYLARMDSITTDTCHLVIIAAYSLAAKYHEIYPPSLEDYVDIVNRKFTANQIRNMEEAIFATLGCNINVPCEIDYARAISTANEVSGENHNTCKYMLVLISLYGSNFLPSVVSTAVMKLVMQTEREGFINHFGVPEVIIDECLYDIVSICKSAAHTNFKTWKELDKDAVRVEFLRVFDIINKTTPKAQKIDAVRKVLSQGTYYKSDLFIKDITRNLLPPTAVPKDAKKLGEGTFGVVKKVTYNGEQYAVKKVKGFIISEGVLASSVLREISILLSLDHLNVVAIRHITTDFRSVFLDLGVGDLRAWITNTGPVHIKEQVGLAAQLLGALDYVHDMGCLHRDIKPQNIIVYMDGRRAIFRLSDFGSSRGCEIAVRDNRFTQNVCTLWYRSPELLLGSEIYNDRLDVWSMLCTLYECATGRPLFPGNNEIDQIMKIFKELGTPVELVDVKPGSTRQVWEDVSLLPNWHPKGPQFSGNIDLLIGSNNKLSPCFLKLFMTGLILDPAMRPTSKTLKAIVDKYI